ncbi:LAFE_0B08944g1_1 [Lachancea fermentati]|uniref:LAFE_0B08944g1_1 n=1 Tax=Lachancea fermentati TaxID=4955 RepID=A0A1G4M8A0_LACFM|nr:LAFE_0B08944g1_1 [Lachancea fermentati]
MTERNIPFPDIEPYLELKLDKDASEQQIKKAYRKLMLLHHPDKTKEEGAQEQFHKIQFSYEILTKFKELYDKTGSVEACFDSTDLSDWKDLFDVDVVINRVTIEEDKKLYRGSEDETQDVIESWMNNAEFKARKRFRPDEDQFSLLFQEVPHLELTTEDEDHIFVKVSELLASGLIEDTNQSFSRWKQNRKKFLRTLQKSIAKEEALAEKMLSKMDAAKRPQSEAHLQQLIRKKNKNTWDSLISKLEKEATGKKRTHAELDDEEFERIQKKLTRKKHK